MNVVSLLFLQAYDATQLVKSYPDSRLDILIDQGKDDQFLSAGQLLPDNFIAACTERKIPVIFRLQQASLHQQAWCLVIFGCMQQVVKEVRFCCTSAVKEWDIREAQLRFTARWGQDFTFNEPIRSSAASARLKQQHL